MRDEKQVGSASGWGGSVFGLTVWLALLAGLALARDVRLGLLLAALLAVQILAALLLGGLRPAWGIARALLWFLGLAACVAAAALLAVDVSGEQAWLRGFAGGVSPYWFLLVYPALAIVVWRSTR